MPFTVAATPPVSLYSSSDATWLSTPEHATLVTESTMASTPMATSTYLMPLWICCLFSRLKSAFVLGRSARPLACAEAAVCAERVRRCEPAGGRLLSLFDAIPVRTFRLDISCKPP